MKTEGLDVVYCVKNNPTGDELRYSLRSLENLKGIRNVWIYGGCPNWVQNVRHVPMIQSRTKWQNTAMMLNEIAQNNEISKNFIWFNDDFYVMKSCDKIDYWFDDRDPDLITRADRTIRPCGIPSRYGNQLVVAAKALEAQGRAITNFELHTPIIFNKKMLRLACLKYPNVGIRRSIYCNEYDIIGKPHKDVKIENYKDVPAPNSYFASTNNSAFNYGKVGEAVRKKFATPCKYEKCPPKPIQFPKKPKYSPPPAGISATPFFKFRN